MLFVILRFLTHPSRRHAVFLIGLVTSVVILGGVGFAIAEHLSLWIGMYWSVTTATTVGYGDVTPHTTAGHLIAVVVMLTTIPLLGAVFALWSGAAAAARMRRLLHMGSSFPEGSYRIVLGMAPVVPTILDELVDTGNSVVLVADVDPATVRREVHHIQGDPTSTESIRKAHPEKADHVLITGQSDGDVLVSTVLLRSLAPNLPMTALVHGKATADALHDLGVSDTISADQLLSHTLAKVLEAPHAGQLLIELLDSEDHRLDEVPAPADLTGRSLSSVRAERNDLVLGLVHNGAVSLGIGQDPSIAAGDTLLIARAVTA